MKSKIKIAAISGSLRKDSYNSGLLKALLELKPDNIEIEILDISSIPIFNDDERLREIPESVKAISEKISSANGLIIASPEYNYSVPGVLKNAIDWISKVPTAPFDGKPAAIMGASTGMLGTVRAQMHLRHIAFAVNLDLLNKPEVYVNSAKEKFDAEGNLNDAKTKEILKRLLNALSERIRKPD